MQYGILDIAVNFVVTKLQYQKTLDKCTHSLDPGQKFKSLDNPGWLEGLLLSCDV